MLTRLIKMFVVVGVASVSLLSYAVELKDDAPTTYTVKKNDTLWDISNLFLDKPWLWPELWRKNTQVVNPHLIYPGDILVIRMVDGEPVIEVQREKLRMTLSPSAQRTVKEQNAINLLPWSVIEPYVGQDEIITSERYNTLPHLLGNKAGAVRFANDDLVLSRRFGRAKDQYRVIRKQDIIRNLEGEELGVQIHHIADAQMVESDAASEWLIRIKDANVEAKRGDKLINSKRPTKQDMQLQAATTQRGHIVDNLHQYELLGKYDVVVVDLGEQDVSPGTVMGIYAQGPTIIDGEQPQYENESGLVLSVFDDGSTVRQPALKIGEVIIFNTFEKASYGIIARSSDLVKKGAIVANP